MAGPAWLAVWLGGVAGLAGLWWVDISLGWALGVGRAGGGRGRCDVQRLLEEALRVPQVCRGRGGFGDDKVVSKSALVCPSLS